jgi:hypothetical protein
MDTPVLYEEVLSASNDRVRRFLTALAIIFGAATVVNLGIERGTPNTLTEIFLAGAGLCLAASVFFSFRLVTQIRADGIYVRYAPLQPSFARFAFTDISRVHLRRFDAIAEYGGWGVRLGPSGRGYVVPAQWGIQLELTDGGRVLIATNHPEEVTAVLHKLGRL